MTAETGFEIDALVFLLVSLFETYLVEPGLRTSAFHLKGLEQSRTSIFQEIIIQESLEALDLSNMQILMMLQKPNTR